MKERLFKSLTAIFLLLCMAFNLFGCDLSTTDSCEHDWVVKESVESTCIKAGSVLRECKICGHNEILDLPLAEHQSGGKISHNKANHWDVCSVCQTAINVVNHEFGNKTDFNDIHHWFICEVCGSADGARYHNFTLSRDLGDGTHYLECEVCGKSYVEKHEMGEWVVDVNGYCEDRIYKQSCSKCDYAITEQGAEDQHLWYSERVQNGYKATCRKCDKVVFADNIDDLPYTEHNWQIILVQKQPTCQIGIAMEACQICGDTKWLELPPVDDHTTSDTYSTTEATHSKYCTVCKEYVEAEDHSFDSAGVCTVCGYQK